MRHLETLTSSAGPALASPTYLFGCFQDNYRILKVSDTLRDAFTTRSRQMKMGSVRFVQISKLGLDRRDLCTVFELIAFVLECCLGSFIGTALAQDRNCLS